MHSVLYSYSFEGVLTTIYGFDRAELECTEPEKGCTFRDPKQMLKQLDVEDAKFYIDFAILLAFFLFLRIACYLVLRWRVKVHWLWSSSGSPAARQVFPELGRILMKAVDKTAERKRPTRHAAIHFLTGWCSILFNTVKVGSFNFQD